MPVWVQQLPVPMCYLYVLVDAACFASRHASRHTDAAGVFHGITHVDFSVLIRAGALLGRPGGANHGGGGGGGRLSPSQRNRAL